MTELESIDYITSRGDLHGLSFEQVMDMIPSVLHDDVTECAEFLELRDVSHILPQSTHPELANDPSNMILEDSSVNRSRGAEPMTELEEMTAMLDNEVLAARIDTTPADLPMPDLIPDWIPVFGLA